VISAGLSQIGGRPDPCGEARFRSDRRRCGDRSSPRLTVPTAPSGKTYITGGPARGQRPYPRMSMARCRFHPRTSRECGRNVDASARRVCYRSGVGSSAHGRPVASGSGAESRGRTVLPSRPPVPPTRRTRRLVASGQSSIRRGLGSLDAALKSHRCPTPRSLSVDSANTPRPRGLRHDPSAPKTDLSEVLARCSRARGPQRPVSEDRRRQRARGAHHGAEVRRGRVRARRDRAPERAGSDACERGAEGATRPWRGLAAPSVVVEAFFD
jgi:hypothetical protein